MNPDRDNNLLFTARKHWNSVSRSSSKNDTVIENEVYPTIQPKTRLSMRSSSSKAFAVSESVERKMKQWRLPVRTPMMHITGYSSANKARSKQYFYLYLTKYIDGYEILNKPRYWSEKKINTVKENMISKFEVISSEKRTINIIPQCPRYKLDSTRIEISSKEIWSLKSKLIFSIIKMLMRNSLRRGFTTWKSFDVRQKVSMEQKSLINQIQ